MATMNAVQQRLKSLLPALVVLVLVLALHSGISHSLTVETTGKLSVQATAAHQASPTNVPGSGHCASDHGWRFQAAFALSCEGKGDENSWQLINLLSKSGETTYPPHRPPITT